MYTIHHISIYNLHVITELLVLRISLPPFHQGIQLGNYLILKLEGRNGILLIEAM